MAMERKCLSRGYQGEMKTWLGNHNLPQLICVILLLAYIIPGIVFAAWGYGKYKSPECGALDKSVRPDAPLSSAEQRRLGPSGQRGREERACPWCAEPILILARVCKHCSRDVA